MYMKFLSGNQLRNTYVLRRPGRRADNKINMHIREASCENILLCPVV
jgi:hypothetical protein